MTPQDHIKLNKAKCLFVNLLICEIQGYWAAYAAKNVIDQEWEEIPSRNVTISEKDFDEISELMEASCLERNPLIIQRLKAKEESTSDCMRRICDSYLSA